MLTIVDCSVLSEFVYVLKWSYLKVNEVKCLHTQSCPTLQPPWTVAHQTPCPWNFPGKNTGVVPFSYSRGSSHPRDGTCISCVSYALASRFFTNSAAGKTPNSPLQEKLIECLYLIYQYFFFSLRLSDI